MNGRSLCALKTRNIRGLLVLAWATLGVLPWLKAAGSSSSPPATEVWPGAIAIGTGWYQVPWYGYLWSGDGWFYHLEHGWQYPVSPGAGGNFVFDATLQCWSWVGELHYPWMYWYEPVNGWAYFQRDGTPGQRHFFLHRKREWRHESQLASAEFSVGPTHSLAVAAPPGGGPLRVEDASSGLGFGVLPGEAGEIHVAPLEVLHPLPPYPGEGWHLSANGLSALELVFDNPGDSPDTAPTVYAYTRMQGAFDDVTGYRERWVALPFRQLPSGQVAFALPVEDSPVAAAAAENIAALADEADAPRPAYFWVSRIDPNSPEVDQRMWLRLQVSDYVDRAINELTAPLRTQVEARRAERSLTLAFGGDYYTGFNKVRASSWGRSFQPVLAIRSPTQNLALAHETGHYLTHLLVGHDVYDTLEKTGGSIFAGSHAIRDSIGRDNLLEDYAYYLESFLIGTGGNFYLERPHIVFKDLSPLTVDFPGLEGFAACMLELLHLDAATLVDYLGDTWPIKPLNLSRGKVFARIADGHTSVNQLRSGIESHLSGTEKKAFQVLLHRLGWRYSIAGRLVDAQGAPLANAKIDSVVKVGADSYWGTYVSSETNADGYFKAIGGGGAFGGESLLSVDVGQDEPIEVTIEIDWNRETRRQVDLGTLVVDLKEEISVPVALDFNRDYLIHGLRLTVTGNGRVRTDLSSTVHIEEYSDGSNKIQVMRPSKIGTPALLEGSYEIAVEVNDYSAGWRSGAFDTSWKAPSNSHAHRIISVSNPRTAIDNVADGWKRNTQTVGSYGLSMVPPAGSITFAYRVNLIFDYTVEYYKYQSGQAVLDTTESGTSTTLLFNVQGQYGSGFSW